MWPAIRTQGQQQYGKGECPGGGDTCQPAAAQVLHTHGHTSITVLGAWQMDLIWWSK